jgi:hypothetical protein
MKHTELDQKYNDLSSECTDNTDNTNYAEESDFSDENEEIDFEFDRPKNTKKKQLEHERELKMRQLKDVDHDKKLRASDIHRIAQRTDTSIFDEDECCLWTGYVTNMKNKKKGIYINFYFKNKKKVALHRLLYANFKGQIRNSEYVKYSCPNKGICCNINHMVKFEYNESDTESSDNDTESNNKKNMKSNKKSNDNNKKSNRTGKKSHVNHIDMDDLQPFIII